MNKDPKIEPANPNDVVEVEAKEIPKEEKEEIKEKVVFTEDKKKLKFYEILRKRILKFAEDKAGHTAGKFTEYVLTLPDFFILLCRLAVDKRVPATQKVIVSGIIAYVISPIDIIPDFIPVIGYIDDIVLVVFGLNLVLNEIDKQVILDNWSGEEDILQLLQKITLAAERFLDKNILRRIKKWIRHIK
ncbi:MAG: DUF1232 domain-containing protein [Candidatus Cloacimonetes bacterium]|nr:DUF1232 domain-containing protein [Candidatus Cloacimonadota bacterium]